METQFKKWGEKDVEVVGSVGSFGWTTDSWLCFFTVTLSKNPTTAERVRGRRDAQVAADSCTSAADIVHLRLFITVGKQGSVTGIILCSSCSCWTWEISSLVSLFLLLEITSSKMTANPPTLQNHPSHSFYKGGKKPEKNKNVFVSGAFLFTFIYLALLYRLHFSGPEGVTWHKLVLKLRLLTLWSCSICVMARNWNNVT